VITPVSVSSKFSISTVFGRDTVVALEVAIPLEIRVSGIGSALLQKLRYSKVIGIWHQVEAPVVWLSIDESREADSIGIV
jgi:hypothetical protein